MADQRLIHVEEGWSMAVQEVTAAPRTDRTRLRRLTDRARTTPGRLSMIMVVLVALSLAAGLASWLALRQRADLVHDMTVRSSPLGASALDIYRSLSDADAAAANGFLTGSTKSAALRARYLEDITQAADALTVASRNAESGSAAADELALLGIRLPVYTGLVETARSIDRQGFPLGAAYLREASGLMRNTMLPAAQRLYGSEKARLAGAHDTATGFPWVAAGLGVLTLAGLVAAAAYLTRRTNRVFNVGLVLAMTAEVAAVVWLVVATVAMAGHLDAGRRDGSTQMQLLAEARVAALQARADEALTLVARGSGQDYETDFRAAVKRIEELLDKAGADASSAADRAATDAVRADLQEWLAVHGKLRQLDDTGRYPEAVALATGSESQAAPAVYARVDTRIDRVIAERSALFAGDAAAAESDLAGSGGLVVALTLLLVAGVVIGIQRRIAEYR
jgi:hypothetical protein